jgi:hypothetical protein
VHLRGADLHDPYPGRNLPLRVCDLRAGRTEMLPRLALSLRRKSFVPRLSQYQPTRCPFIQLKARFDMPLARFGLHASVQQRIAQQPRYGKKRLSENSWADRDWLT